MCQKYMRGFTARRRYASMKEAARKKCEEDMKQLNDTIVKLRVDLEPLQNTLRKEDIELQEEKLRAEQRRIEEEERKAEETRKQEEAEAEKQKQQECSEVW